MSETSTAPETAPIDPAVEAALVASREARIESLLELARIPSVSALHEHAGDMVATAEWIAGRLRGLGATEVEVIATDLHPIVYGRIHEAPGAPTVIVYCHYDVQPVDPLDLWEHPPFEPFVRDGRFIGRGVVGRQGPARDAPERARGPARGRPGAGGQPDLRVRGRGGVRLREPGGVDRPSTATGSSADVVVISDTGFFEGNLPAITVGLRGHHVRADRRRAVAGRPPLRHVRRHGPEPGQRAGHDRRRAQGPRRPDPHPGLLRRRGRR